MESDDQLVASIGVGRDRTAAERAMKALHMRHAGFLLQSARRLLGGRGDPEVLVSETFLRMWRAAERYEPRGALRAYLYRILFRLAMSELELAIHRREAVGDEDTIARDETVGEHVGPDVPLLRREARDEATRLLDALLDALEPGPMREVFELRFRRGFSEKETMLALDIPRSRLAYLVRRGRKLMRDRLEQLGYTELGVEAG